MLPFSNLPCIKRCQLICKLSSLAKPRQSYMSLQSCLQDRAVDLYNMLS